MTHGPPIELLFYALRGGETFGIGVHGPRFWASLVLKGRRVHHAEGIPGLLGPLEAELPNPARLQGHLTNDIALAMESGFALDAVLDAACMGVGLFLASLVGRDDVNAHLQPSRVPPAGSFPLPEPMLRIFARGLAELRSADQVAAELQPLLGTTVRAAPGAPPPELDPVVLRTLRLVRPNMTLNDLILASGRHQRERTAHALQAIDLLMQTGLLAIDRPDRAPRVTFSSYADEPSAPTIEDRPFIEILDADSNPQELGDEHAPLPPKPPTPSPGPARPQPPRKTEPLPAEEAAVLDLAARCSELNPLVVLKLHGEALNDIFTLQGIQAAFSRQAAIFRPEAFTRASLDTLEAVSALDEIFRSSREALYDPAIVALWLRELRAFAELPPEANEDDARRARELFERAQALAYRRVWTEAQHAAMLAARLDPRQARYRILDIFCRVAARQISPVDGVMNLDALFLTEPKEQALAQVTAGRLLKAAGRRSQAMSRFKTALQLDPDRADAKSELESTQP